MTEIPKHLRRSLYSDKSFSQYKLKKPINQKDIKKVRVVTKPRRYIRTWSFLVYPMYYANRKWYCFFDGETPLVSQVRPLRINGIGGQAEIGKYIKSWKDWLKKWIKENKLSVKIEEEPKPEKQKREKKKKKEKKEDFIPDVPPSANEDDETGDTSEHSQISEDSLSNQQPQ
jgi:hypothetical protein